MNVVYRIPHWTTYTDDRNTVDVEYADDPFDCLRLTVTRVPCIVTLNKVPFMLYIHIYYIFIYFGFVDLEKCLIGY